MEEVFIKTGAEVTSFEGMTEVACNMSAEMHSFINQVVRPYGEIKGVIFTKGEEGYYGHRVGFIVKPYEESEHKQLSGNLIVWMQGA